MAQSTGPRFRIGTFPLLLCVVVVLGLGAYQNTRLDRILEAEKFYRWILSAAQQSELGWKLSEIYVGETQVTLMDEPLFDSVVQAMESRLPEVPITEEDTNAEGEVHPKLVRIVQQNLRKNDATPYRVIWDYARSDDAASLRQDFLTYYDERRLASAGTQFNISEIYNSDVYGEGGASVSLGSMFLGLRKMTANMIWLEVDKYWHLGMMHRMVPLMYLTVALDPNFVDAYLLGAWHLAYNQSVKVDDTPEEQKVWDERHQDMVGAKERLYYQGADFLKDGIQKNPFHYKLYFDLGYAIYKQKLEDYPNAIKYLERATRVEHDRWVRRALYGCYQLNEQYEEALMGYEAYGRQFPEYRQAPRLILYNKALIKERDSNKAGDDASALETQAESEPDAAKKAGLLQEAATKRAEQRRLLEEGRAFWREVLQKHMPNDSLAMGHMLITDALEDRSSQRYWESIAKLQQARINIHLYDYCNDLIIEIKQEAGIELNLSEKEAIVRKRRLEERRQQVMNPAASVG